MAEPTAVNGQITDAVTQADVEVLAQAPAQALGTVYQTFAQSMGLSIENALARQQQWYSTGTAATTQSVNLVFSMGPFSATAASQDLASANTLAGTLAQLSALTAAVQQMLASGERAGSAIPRG